MNLAEVERFDADLTELVAVTGSTVDAMRRLDEWYGGSERWVARRDGDVVAVLTAHRRPDDRIFVRLDGFDDTWSALCEAASGRTGSPLFSTPSDERVRASLVRCGFAVASVSDVFEVTFAALAQRVRHAAPPDGIDIISADDADRDALFALDIELRNDVPGTDGWRGNRVWFDDELAERPPYDPDGYVVGRDRTTGSLVGLARFWRNASGPRLGLIGVIRRWRRTRLAAALLHRASEAARTWGSDTFTTETSRSNRAVHPHLRGLGASPTDSIVIMVRR